ncbi:hypothetical protein QJQ45_012270 [Haematococcus lacustris]|nr:hypothetical protein QJQ45_012270 [Haematococcus lacustris]
MLYSSVFEGTEQQRAARIVQTYSETELIHVFTAVKAMVDKRGVKANRANLQKAREVMAKRKAAEAKAKAHAGAAEAEAQAQARAGENGAQAKAEAELLLRPRLRPKLMLVLMRLRRSCTSCRQTYSTGSSSLLTTNACTNYSTRFRTSSGVSFSARTSSWLTWWRSSRQFC